MGRPVYHPCAWERGLTINFNTTQYAGLFNGSVALTSTVADRQSILRPGGDIIRAGFYVTTNTITTSPTVLTLNVNGSDTGLTVSIGVGVTNSWVHSTGGPIAIADGDLVCWKVATPNTSGALFITNSYFESIAAGRTVQWWLTTPFGSENNVTRYGPWMGSYGYTTNPAVQYPVDGTILDLNVATGVNARPVIDTFDQYVNGAVSAQSVPTVANTAGPYTDSDDVSITAGDTVVFRIIWGASATATRFGPSAGFAPAGEAYGLVQIWAKGISPGATHYVQLAGNTRGFTAEADAQTYWTRPGTISGVQLKPLVNGVNTATHMILRKNGGDTAIDITIPTASTSVLGDSDSVAVAAGDLLNWKCVVGTGGTNLAIAWLNMIFTPAPSFLPQRNPIRFMRLRA